MRIKYLLIHLILLIPLLSFSENQIYSRKISWTGIRTYNVSEDQTISIITFSGSKNNFENDYLPVYYERFALETGSKNLSVELRNQIYELCSSDESFVINEKNIFSDQINISSDIAYEIKLPFACISFVPIRKNEITGFYEKLISFDIKIEYEILNDAETKYKSSAYSENSVLATGNWFKIAVSSTGIHILNADNLNQLGIALGSIDPRNIRIYGNGGGMLPEDVNTFRFDDLQENAIYVSGENDGSFNQGDFILFYGESPNEWKYSDADKKLHHYPHLYSDNNYYFLTTDLGPGKRVQNQPSTVLPATLISTKFDDAYHYELEDTNLIGTGRTWYGETFDLNTVFIKELSFNELDLGSKIHFAIDVAARSEILSSFSIYANNSNIKNLSIAPTNSSSLNVDFAKTKHDTVSFFGSNQNFSIKIEYNKPLQTSVGYLNYFTLNVKRNLSFPGGQMIFRDLRTANTETITEYKLSKSNSNVVIWNITDRMNCIKVDTEQAGSQLIFRIQSDDLQEFIAFDGSSFFSPVMIGKIENQNLHNLDEYEMIIVTHPSFMQQALQLAEHHNALDDMSVLVIQPQEIYNEFSSGAQDITAIRDFVKMMHDNASTGNEPKYLLLFGDASYDYKNRIANNSNYVPTWESPESLNPVGSYIADDFFGLLDGDNLVDIGIGRFVVSTADQAQSAVEKVIHYSSSSDEVMNDWRNVICLIADDEDSNLHFSDSEELAQLIDTTNKNINIDKIYLDAYVQESTPSGEQYPKATEDINNRVNRGALIVNYVGHGGELGLAHERIIKVADVNSWDNINNMPVFLTATCEFSRFDDPKRTSAGEMVFLNSKGGGISLFTTTRATYAGGNASLNKNFYKFTLKETNGQYMRMGDVVRLSKNATGNDSNTRKFVLLGDPALKFAFPKHDVITSTINNISVLENADTLNALAEVTIKGEIQDFQGNKLSNFNGILFPIVYDKPAKYTTLGNDEQSYPAVFYIQKNPLYKGKSTITGGEWSFSFLVPKDIAYEYGFGKMSYYAKNEVVDGAGNFTNIIVGGYNQNGNIENNAPMVKLYLNNDSFIAGGLTDENPILIAEVSDESGINTVGSGIGHDIVATLDGSQNYVLNDFYEADLDDYTNGIVNYPFANLSPGHHNLSLKLWDINNNSATAYTDFIVAESNEMTIENLLNYPNPFKDATRFTFEHNQPDQLLEVKIEIFSLEGQLVTTIQDQYYADGYRYKSSEWNGTNDKGGKLKNGIYIYRVSIRNAAGTFSHVTNKLVILQQGKQ